MPKTEVFKAFEQLVSEYFSMKSTNLIYNSSKEHAGILIRKIVSDAKGGGTGVKLFTSGDDVDFYHNCCMDVPSTTPIAVVLEDSDHLSEYKGCFPKHAEFYKVKENGKGFAYNFVTTPNEFDSRYAPFRHFIVVGNSWRIEKPHPQSGVANVDAVACAYSPQVASVLNAIFTKDLVPNSEKI